MGSGAGATGRVRLVVLTVRFPAERDRFDAGTCGFADAAGSGRRFAGFARSRSRINALIIFKAARASRSVRWP